MIKRIIIILFGAFSLLSCEKVGDSPLPIELKNTNFSLWMDYVSIYI